MSGRRGDPVVWLRASPEIASSPWLLAKTIVIFCHCESYRSRTWQSQSITTGLLRYARNDIKGDGIASSLTRAPYTGRSVEKKIKSSLNAPRNDSGGEVRLVSMTIKANYGKLLRVGPDLNCFSFLKKKVLFFLKNQAVNNNGVKSCQNESLSLVFFSILFRKFPNADRWD